MSIRVELPRQAATPARAPSREETWSLTCVSCEVTVAATSRQDLAGLLRDEHEHCEADSRVYVEYTVTTEETRRHPASRPHLLWLDLPAGVVRHVRSVDADVEADVTPVAVDIDSQRLNDDGA